MPAWALSLCALCICCVFSASPRPTLLCFLRYKRRMYYWELLILARKSTFIFIALFMQIAGVQVQVCALHNPLPLYLSPTIFQQASCAMIIVLLSIVATLEVRPYAVRHLQNLDIMAMTVTHMSLLVIYWGDCLYLPSSLSLPRLSLCLSVKSHTFELCLAGFVSGG